VAEREEAERARLEREFFAEAEEIFERAAAQLAALDAAAAARRPAAPIVHLLFREIHALKGAAGSLGFAEIGDLAHACEDLLDRLRADDIPADPTRRAAVDDALDALTRLVRERRRGRAGAPPAGLAERLRAAAAAPAGTPDAIPVDPRILASLSRHEEDRLRARLRAGDALFLARVSFAPATLDTEARAVTEALAAWGEVLAMLPEPAVPPAARPRPGAAAGRLPFAFLVAASRPPGDAAGDAGGVPVTLEPLGAAPPPAPAGAPEDDTLPGLPAESVRVPIARLDDLLARVGDLSVAAAALLDAARRARETRPGDRDLRDLDRRARALAGLLRALQRGAVQVRLVPMTRAFAPLARLAVRVARESGKEVDLTIRGGGTEIDKAVMDELAAPLRHLVLNALDHGLEPPEDRVRAGKPGRGRVVLAATQKGGRAIIEIADDGRGVDPAGVRAAAEAAGRITPGASLGVEQARALIFLPGVSTAPGPGPVSGRGVGLDAVRGAIRRLKGSVTVRSEPGRGTTFTLTVPISLALLPALIVRAGGRRFAIPMGGIDESLRIDPARIRRAAGNDVYERPRGPMRLRRVADLAGRAADAGGPEGRYLVVAAGGGLGLVVDELLGRQEIVVKPLGGRLRDIPGLAGAADLGDATAVLVLDPRGLAGEAGAGDVAA
jgi:two-component system chemotaxis sensor kinase CheA